MVLLQVGVDVTLVTQPLPERCTETDERSEER
jgi:hypothetical protein